MSDADEGFVDKEASSSLSSIKQQETVQIKKNECTKNELEDRAQNLGKDATDIISHTNLNSSSNGGSGIQITTPVAKSVRKEESAECIRVDIETCNEVSVENQDIDKQSSSSSSNCTTSLLVLHPTNIRHIKNAENPKEDPIKFSIIDKIFKKNEINQSSTSPSSSSSSSLVDLVVNEDQDHSQDSNYERVQAVVSDALITTETEVKTNIHHLANTDVKAKETQIPKELKLSDLSESVEIKNHEDGNKLISCDSQFHLGGASKLKSKSSVPVLLSGLDLDLLTGFATSGAAANREDLDVEEIGADNTDINYDRIISEPLPIFDYSVSDFGGPWSCTTCTYLNFSNGPTCLQCNAQKIQFNFTSQVESELDSNSQLSSALKPLKISDYEDVCLSSSSPSKDKETFIINSGRSDRDPPIYLPLSSSTPANITSAPTSTPNKPNSAIPIPLPAPKTTTTTTPLPITVNGSNHYYCDYETSGIGVGTGTSNNKQVKNNFSATISTSYDEYWIDPPVTTNEADDKWACPMCTFENWPASSKCSMCLTLREVVVFNSSNIQQDSSNNNSEIIENNRVLSESMANSSYTQRLRNRKFEADARWLEACRGVVSGNIAPIEEFLARGGDPTRQLTSSEVAILNRPSAFDVGYTLVHLALRFQHQETLAMLLSHLDCSNTASVVKRVPSYVAPDLDQDIRNHVMNTIRYGKGNFRCNFSSEIATFTLPSGIQDLSSDTQETLYDEILDRDVQKELESGQFINWSSELMVQLNSRLYALWNRSAGDCLLDSVLQATWGIFDKDNRLRQSLANSLRESASLFYQRWRENEILLSHMLDFSLDETQCATDWDNLLSVAGQPGSSLEQLHIFALAHIFRRPIIVYSVKFVKSYLGETLGYARYEGVYLPLLWDSSLCWKWPIALGYTRGHFSALVPQEPHSDPLARVASASQLDGDGMSTRCTYLPLNTADGNLLPIHFLSQAEVGNEEMILSQWLDLSYTNSGVLVARQRIQKRPLLVAQLVEEWLNHYRTLGQMGSTPYMRQSTAACYSSDGDSDND